MKNKPSKKQLKYAYGLLNDKKTKYQIAIDAGFSSSMARIPRVIEKAKGFKLAMAQIAGEVENTTLKIMYELQTRDLAQEDTETLLKFVSTLSLARQMFSNRSN